MLIKHEKYKEKYGAGEVYWGFGIEHETYLESAVFMCVYKGDLKDYRRPERYSVSYYKSYKEADLEAALDSLPVSVDHVPILLNNHSFTYCDTSMNHMTTYERIAKKNPRFNGKTLHDEFIEASPWYKDAYNKWVVYDGDTFEFMNVDFYKTNIYDALEEVWEAEDKFVWEFNHFIMKKENCPIATYGPYGIARANYPFAKHITNPNHYTMFNNGTVHINLTLPTKLDLSGTIENMDEFVERHRVVARYIQWFEPLLVLVYGQEDPFRSMCSDPSVASRFSGGSQRLAVSRYIGLSNYDTAEMPRGKILTEPAAPGTWYDEFYKVMAYERLAERGFDINFNKHLSHGIELRIFDGLRRQQMLELCETIARICRLALARPLAPLCKDSADFSALAVGIMIEGADYLIPYSVVQGFLKAVRLEGGITIDEKEPIIAGVFVGRILAWVDKQPMLEEYAGAVRQSSK